MHGSLFFQLTEYADGRTPTIVRRSNSLIYSVRMRGCSRSKPAGSLGRHSPRIDHDSLGGKSLRWGWSLFAQSINRVCGCGVLASYCTPSSNSQSARCARVQDALAHRAAFACVCASVCHGNASSLQKWCTTIDCHCL